MGRGENSVKSGPSIATIKRLFAVSGNMCAFPSCEARLVDESSGKVLGRICHIKGRRPNAPRYDKNQTDRERHAFDNLLLMCPIHHDVIDADPESYTVERLKDIKTRHEALWADGSEPSKEIAEQFIADIDITISNGSFIYTKNQMGGQVAHSIVNIGQQPRKISQVAASQLIMELKNYPGEQVDIVSLAGDYESFDFAQILESLLKLADWQSSGVSQGFFTGVPRGVIIETVTDKPAVRILGNWLLQNGFNVQGILSQKAQMLKIVVGTAT